MGRTPTTVKSNQTRSIVAKYAKGAGLVALATEFEIGVGVVRRVLIEAGETIRGRGRPAKAE